MNQSDFELANTMSMKGPWVPMGVKEESMIGANRHGERSPLMKNPNPCFDFPVRLVQPGGGKRGRRVGWRGQGGGVRGGREA